MKNHSQKTTASYIALRDIANYLSENNLYKMFGEEIWTVTPTHLNTKETRKLNRLLGLRNINNKYRYARN